MVNSNSYVSHYQRVNPMKNHHFPMGFPMIFLSFSHGIPPMNLRSWPRHERPVPASEATTSATSTELAQVEVDPLDVFMSGMEDELTKEPWFVMLVDVFLGWSSLGLESFGCSCWVLCWVLLHTFTTIFEYIHIYTCIPKIWYLIERRLPTLLWIHGWPSLQFRPQPSMSCLPV